MKAVELSVSQNGSLAKGDLRAGSELGFIGAHDSPRVAAIIHLKFAFRRGLEPQGDTPVGIARGCKRGEAGN